VTATGSRLAVAITADPELPVPPTLYGGIERVIDLLIRGLVARGHEVTLFGHPDSDVPCRLVPYVGGPSRAVADTLRNMGTVTRGVRQGGYDVVHSFGRIAYLLPLLTVPIAKLMTYQREVTPRSVRWGHTLSRGTLHFSAISSWKMAETSHLANWHLVYNGVPMAFYDFLPAAADDAPLVFLGRVEHIQGAHLAIEIARKAGRKLVIVGNVPPEHRDDFDRHIRPHLGGERISHVGPVDDGQKNVLPGRAAAFLMPIPWEKPFGIVKAEALACGTPVVGLRRGSVPRGRRGRRAGIGARLKSTGSSRRSAASPNCPGAPAAIGRRDRSATRRSSRRIWGCLPRDGESVRSLPYA